MTRSQGHYWEEDEDVRVVWGVLSGDSMTGSVEPSLYTMNDIALLHWADGDIYSVDIETIYEFKNKADELEYLRELLDRFTAWMKGQGRSTDYKVGLQRYFSAIHDGCYSSIEEAYAMFRMMVEGYTATHRSER